MVVRRAVDVGRAGWLFAVVAVLAASLATTVALAVAPPPAGAAPVQTVAGSISVGETFACGVTTVGAVACWGSGSLRGGGASSITPAVVPGLESGMVAVSAGNRFACALTSAGGVKCWGLNNVGQLGNNTAADSTVPVDVVGLSSGVTDLATGYAHACAVTSTGGLKCWGKGNLGALGTGTSTTSRVPVDVVGLGSGVREVDAGGFFFNQFGVTTQRDTTCAVTVAGAAKCWGSNNSGQLGDGTTTGSPTPRDVVGLSSGVRSIDASYSQACAVLVSGAVRCWGSGTTGQLGNGTTTSSSVPVPVTGLSSGVAAVSVGTGTSCAVLATGTLRCWGVGSSGELGNGDHENSSVPVAVSGLSAVVAVSTSYGAACALTVGGEVSCWGATVTLAGNSGRLGSANPYTSSAVAGPGFGSGVTAVVANHRSIDGVTCAVSDEGAVSCAGRRSYWTLGDGATEESVVPVTPTGLGSGVRAVSAGEAVSCALMESGGVKCWGDEGQLGAGLGTGSMVPIDVPGLTGAESLVSGPTGSCAVSLAGAVTCWSSAVAPLTAYTSGVASFAMSEGHDCAASTAGAVTCFGGNRSGQLGNGVANTTVVPSTAPVAVAGLSSGVTAVAIGSLHSCALLATGGLRCWGENGDGQLGIGSTTDSTTPVDVSGLSSGVTAIGASGTQTCALLEDGTVRCWGRGSSFVGAGSSTTPVQVPGVSGASAISVGATHACAIASGQVRCWGENRDGELGVVPSNWSPGLVVGGLTFGPASAGVPEIVGDRAPAANGFGWNNEPVSVSFTCSSVALASCTAPSVVSTDGAGQSVGGTVTDLFGQSASTTVSGINIDRVAPTLAGLATRPPDEAGWYRTPVTMAWSCDDDRSGVPTCPADSTTVGEGTAVSVSRSVSDRAGNTTTATSESVQVDLTAPSTGVSSAPTWSGSSVTLTLSPVDALSGVASTSYRVDGGPVRSGTRPVVSGEGTHTLECWSTDVAGNVESTASTTVRIDLSAPSIVASVSPEANENGWHRGPVTVTFACGDEGGSEVASCSPPRSFATEVDTVVSGSAVDGAGNTASAQATVRIDLHAPTVTALVPPANGYGWFNAPVQVPFSCSDTGGSGVASCPAPVLFAGEGADQAVSGTGTDLAGNEGSASGASVSLDVTAPTISGAVVEADNGHGGYYGAVHVHWTCDDALSGVVSCPADEVVSGDGVHVVTASVNDRAGNTTSAEVSVRIDHDPSTDPGIVHGTITDSASGQPLAGALVRLWNPAGSTVLYSATSGTDGRYTFPIVADGSYKLGVTKWGTHLAAYYPNAANTAVAQTIVVAHGTDRTADQALSPGHVLSGTLTAAGSGAPVSGATVRLSTGTWVTTDSAGRWEVPGNVTGSVGVTFLAYGFETATANVSLGGPTMLDRALTASAVSSAGMKGTVRVAAPAGVAAGATVRIWLKDAGTYAATVTTNAQGRYQLPDLPVGRYEVDALRGGSRRWAPNVLGRASASLTTITASCAASPDLSFGDPCAASVDITF